MRHASYMHPPICTQSTPSWTNALCDASGEAHAQVTVCSSHEAIEIEPCLHDMACDMYMHMHMH